MRRDEIWWAKLLNPAGSGPSYKRPVLIVQANPFNASRIAAVIVTVITSNLKLAEAPGNICISPSDSGLPQPSVINISQLITLDRAILTSKIGALANAAMNQVNTGLKLVLALS